MGDEQACLRCHTNLHSRRYPESFWKSGVSIVSDGRGSMGVISPVEALNFRLCGRQSKIYQRPACIQVHYDPPPIPTCNFDWCAYEDGMEERGFYGYGRSREEAVAALFEMFEDDAS
jgi:hypothetical protein